MPEARKLTEVLGPTHLKLDARDKRSLYGVKDPLPVCLVAYAAAHTYHQERCRDCYEAADLAGML